MRAADGLCNFCRPPSSPPPPPPGCSLITFFIAANLKFRFAALPLLTMTLVACCRGDRMLALFWCGTGANWGQGDNLYQVLYNPVGAVFFFFILFFAPHCSEVRMVDVIGLKGSSMCISLFFKLSHKLSRVCICQSTLRKLLLSAPPPPSFSPSCKKLWCSFEIRELGRHDNSVGRAEYVKSVQWGAHC